MPSQHPFGPGAGFRNGVLRNSILMASSLARTRFLIVSRPMTNEPNLRDRVQKCVKPGAHRFGSKTLWRQFDWDVPST